ncbi:MAG TPA: TRAP transporter substrate-binding protein [Casimicrobiaceae bacterium]|jgi:tripartite ATP-independent transporter DctP family solute receptor
MIARRNALRAGIAALLLALGGLLPAGFASAQQKLVMKASDVHPEGYPTVAAVESMGKKLEKATNGRLSIQMYAAMQLGGEKEAIEQAQVGAIQFARVSVGALGPVIDELNVFNMPYLFRSTAHMQKVIDGPIGQELMDKVTNNPKAGLVALCWMDAGARSLYDTKKPIRNIDDLKGMKFRVMGNPMFVDMMNSLGGNGVAMGYDQVFNALQTGVVDGAENNPPSFVFDNHYQVAKYYTLDEHLIVPEMLVFSKKTWDTLSKEDQALLVKFGREAQLEERVLWEKYEKDAMDKARAAGIQITEIADKKPFQAAVKPVWDKYGPKYADMIKRIQAVQ